MRSRPAQRFGTAPALLVCMLVARSLGASEVVVDLVVDIPAVLAVDVSGALLFDLSQLRGPSSPTDCENVFPPGPACDVVTYDPTGARTVTVSIFDNAEGRQTVLLERVAPSWTGGPGSRVPTQDLNARDAAGGGALTRLSTTPAEVFRTAAQGRWVRVERSFRLVTKASNLVETPRDGLTTTITYTVSRAD